MTIIEAQELAMSGKTVICPAGQEWVASDFTDKDWCHPTHDQVFGEWKEKREPRRVYLIMNENNAWLRTSFERSAIEPLQKGERIVEFVEVIK